MPNDGATPANETYRIVDCPDCDHGTLWIADAVYMDCDTCDAAVLRNEVGI